MSIDERDDDDREGQGQSVPFVINEELANQYGAKFSVSLEERGIPVVKTVF